MKDRLSEGNLETKDQDSGPIEDGSWGCVACLVSGTRYGIREKYKGKKEVKHNILWWGLPHGKP